MFFRSHAGSRSLRIWRRCLSGSQQPLLLTRQCAHQPITTWERISTKHSWRLDCLSLPCAWNCPWERSPTWHNGITIPCAVCDRRSSSCICPSSRWVALTPWCTGCKPSLQNRRLLRAGLRLSGRGAANLSLIGHALFSGAGPGRSPNPASNQSMKPTARLGCNVSVFATTPWIASRCSALPVRFTTLHSRPIRRNVVQQ